MTLLRWVWIVALVTLALAGSLSEATRAQDRSIPSSVNGTRAALADPESGQLEQQYWSRKDYDAHAQNWAAAHDAMGRLYVANTAGVLAFDGTTWQLVETANQSIARSVAVDGQNRVFVGAQEEIGRLVRDDTGTLHYRSLTRHVPEAARDFSDVWRTLATTEGIYFLSFERLLRWNPSTQTMQTWTPTESFGMANVVRDTLFVQDRGQGLHAVVGDTLQPVAPGADFGDEMVRAVLPHGAEGLLVGTDNGLFERANNQFRPFRTEAAPLLADAWVYSGTTLPDGTIALGMIGDGMVVLGPEGALLRHRPARGKPVTSLHAGPQGGLWALLDGGILRYGTEARKCRLRASGKNRAFRAGWRPSSDTGARFTWARTSASFGCRAEPAPRRPSVD